MTKSNSDGTTEQPRGDATAGEAVKKPRLMRTLYDQEVRVARLALGASLISLLLTIAGLIATNVWSHKQWEIQKEDLATQRAELDETRRQFDLTRGHLVIEAYVRIYDRETGKWTEGEAPFAGQQLAYDHFGDAVYVLMDVVNDGQAAARIESAGVMLGPDESDYFPTSAFCLDADRPTVVDCAFTVTLEPQHKTAIYAEVGGIRDKFACNDFLRERGIIGALKTIDGTVIQAETDTREPFSNDCSGPVAPPT